jgi:hypothetical protein
VAANGNFALDRIQHRAMWMLSLVGLGHDRLWAG